jgi:two-component system chemotaxis response regulator CheB
VTHAAAPHADRSPRRIVVVGASAGGVQALMALVSRPDADLDGSVLIVLHVSPSGRSVLPDILNRAGPLRAAHPRDYEPLVSGFVYVAPPDRHLLLNDDTIRVTGGPWENGHRPSIDVLFRSAARWHGANVIAVVLSGALDDGAAGVAAVAEQGGTVLIQDPHEAEVPDMPTRALETVPDATVGSLTEIADRINKLTSEAPRAARREKRRTPSRSPWPSSSVLKSSNAGSRSTAPTSTTTRCKRRAPRRTKSPPPPVSRPSFAASTSNSREADSASARTFGVR